MDLAGFSLIMLAGCLVSIDAVFKSCGLEIALHDKTITSRKTWEHKGVWDKLACAVACMNDPHCLTFNYFPSWKICIGYPNSLKHMDNLPYKQNGGSIVVRTCRDNIGQKCSENDDCSVHDSVCFDGVCLCRPGLYFSPRHNGCHKECTEYGDDMDLYKGAGITKHNDKELVSQSLTSCLEACTEEKDFTCLTAEYCYASGTCELSRLGYLDVKKSDRAQGDVNWVMAQRRCK